MASQNTFSPCCFKSFQWEGTPTGTETKLGPNNTYVTGDNPNAAVLYIHDALGWNFTNARLLADHFAREANVTVWLPDFFGGEELNKGAILAGRWHELDMDGFRKRNAREIREPEILAAAKALREQGYKKLGAVGYCFGGFGTLLLAAQSPPIVDAIVCAHPSWINKADIDRISVPVQFLAPETDHQFLPELKMYAFQKLVVERKDVPFEYVHFPGVAHGCLTKGDENTKGEREAMVKGKNAAVAWFRQYLS